MMSRTQRLIVCAVTCLPVLAMTIIGAVHLRNQVNRVLRESAWLLSDEIGRQIGRHVRVGKAYVTPLGRIVLQDVAVAQGASFAQGKLAVVKRVAAAYDIEAILLQGAGASGVGSVEVIQPTVWVTRREDGTLNISDLLMPKPGPPRPPFAGRIKVSGGTVHFRDAYSNRGGAALVTTVRDLDFFLSGVTSKDYRFRVSARSSPGRFAYLDAAGLYRLADRGLWLDVNARRLDAAFAAATLGVRKQVEVSRGTVDFAATVSARLGGKKWPDVFGIARFSRVSFKPKRLAAPVEDLTGTVMMGGESALVDLSASFAGAKARVKGSVAGARQPKLSLTLTARNINVSRLAGAARLPALPKEIGVSRVSTLDAYVTGTAADPHVALRASVPEATVQGRCVTNVEIAGEYSDRWFDVRSADLVFRGARISASGGVGLEAGTSLNLEGRVRNLDLAFLPLPKDYHISGRAEADFVVSGTVNEPVVSVDAVAKAIRFRGVGVDSVGVRASASKREIRIRQLEVLGVAGGTITGRGSISGDKLDLRISAAGVRLDSLGKLVGAQQLRGTAYAYGAVSGHLADPVFCGTVEAFESAYGDQKLDYARASITANRSSVRISSAVGRWFPAEVRLAGKLDLLEEDRVGFEVAGQVGMLDLERVLEAIGRRADVKGMMSGDFVASGTYYLRTPPGVLPLRSALASGTLRLEDGTAFGYAVDDATAQWTFRENVLNLSDTLIASEGARLVLGGSVYADKREIDLDFYLADFDLARIRDRIPDYLGVSGIVSASGAVTGPWKDFTVELTGGARDLVVNRLSFDRATARAVYSGDMLKSGMVDLARGNQRYAARMSELNLSTLCAASADIQATNANVPEIWGALRSSPYMRTERAARLREILSKVPKITGGSADLTAHLGGCVTSPDGRLEISARDIGVDTQRIESVTLLASAANGVVSLRELVAKSGEMIVTASGEPLYENGDLQLSLSANNIDLSRLRAFLDENTPTGTMSLELLAHGKAKAPVVTMSIEVADPAFRGLKFDRLRAARIDIANGKISFPDPDTGIILAVGNHQVIGCGYLPWDWSSLSIPTNQDLELTAELDKEDLSILGSFVSIVEPDRTKGPVEAIMKVKGTLASPRFDGALAVKDGTIALKGFANDFENVNADVVFDGNHVIVNDLSAKSSLGGSVAVKPGSIMALTQADPEVNLTLVADGLKVAERHAFGLRESVSMRLDMGLIVTGSLSKPLIVDAEEEGLPKGIIVSDALVRFAIPEKTPDAKPFRLPLNPRFDIGFELGRDVKLQPPSMSLVVGGGGSLTGTFNDPTIPLDLVMEVNVKRGSLLLAATRLSVQPGSTIMVRYSPPAEPVVRLQDFKATASVMATSELGRQERYQINLGVSGPLSNMQIDLTSSPAGLSKQKMLTALGHVEGVFATGERGLQQEIATAVRAVGSSALLRPVETVFTEQLGFEQFSLEYSPIMPLSLYLSRRLVDSIYVSYYQLLQSNVAAQSARKYQLRLSWRFRQFYELSVTTDDQAVTSMQIGYTKAFE